MSDDRRLENPKREWRCVGEGNQCGPYSFLWRDETHDRCGWVIPESEALTVVRRGVESGTIKGKVETTILNTISLEPGTYLVIPVSDGGSET